MSLKLPYSIEAEKQVLANMIFSSDILVETFSRLSPNDFYDEKHKIIYTTLNKSLDEPLNESSKNIT